MTAAQPQPATLTKTCTRCDTTKPHTEFTKNRTRRDGHDSRCRDCKHAGARAYREANRDKIATADASYYAANKTSINAKRKPYLAHYHASNPHVKWAHKYRKRAEKYGLPIVCDNFTRDDVIAYWGTDRCLYCDGPFQQIDHLIPVIDGGTHTLPNVGPCCKPCNDINSGPAIIRRRRAEEPR